MMPTVPGDALVDVPLAWKARLAGHAWVPQTMGRTEAAVFRIEAPGRPSLFAKTEIAGPFSEVPREAARLRWLSRSPIPCPEVIAELREGQRDWLLMSGAAGLDLASSPHLGPGRTVEIAADALRALHRLDIESCPFDHRLEIRIADARARMEAGLVDEDDFDDERRGRPARDVFAELLARRPEREDLVVTHGDACLPNLLAENDRFTGFVDCARLGVADRHQDLALATRSIRHDLGEEWVEPFFLRYGTIGDHDRLAYYRLLDEFF
jgi:aminoglycoside 3'-phosphotransferase-2